MYGNTELSSMPTLYVSEKVDPGKNKCAGNPWKNMNSTTTSCTILVLVANMC